VVVFQIEVFRVVTPCTVVAKDKDFRSPYWRWRQYGSLEYWHPTI